MTDEARAALPSSPPRLSDFLDETFSAVERAAAVVEYAAIRSKGAAERRAALKYAHEDGKTREYTYTDGGRLWFASEARTWCGHWFTVCRDDPAYLDEVWRWSQPDDRPTCPACLAVLLEDERP